MSLTECGGSSATLEARIFSRTMNSTYSTRRRLLALDPTQAQPGQSDVRSANLPADSFTEMNLYPAVADCSVRMGGAIVMNVSQD